MANRGGDFLRDVEPVGVEVDVVGDERHARADHGGARRRVRLRRAEIRRPFRRRHLRREPLELAAADVLEVPARRSGRGLLVQIDRHAESFGDRRAHVARQRRALLQRDPFDRHEGHDVHRSETRVLALMGPEVDRGHGPFEERQRRGLERGGVSDEREHGPVVRGVRRDIQQLHVRRAADRVGELAGSRRDAVLR